MPWPRCARASFSTKREEPAPASVPQGGPERQVCGRQSDRDSATGRNEGNLRATRRPCLKDAAVQSQSQRSTSTTQGSRWAERGQNEALLTGRAPGAASWLGVHDITPRENPPSSAFTVLRFSTQTPKYCRESSVELEVNPSTGGRVPSNTHATRPWTRRAGETSSPCLSSPQNWG